MSFDKIAIDKKKERKLIPNGVYVARCYSVVDLGTQESEYQGEKKYLRKVRVTFEIPSLMEVFDKEKGEQPKVIGKTYTLSDFSKSNLVKDFMGWFSDSKEEGDILYLLENKTVGRAVMMNIGSFENTYGTFNCIESLNPLMAGQECVPQINPSLKFDLNEIDNAVFEKLPPFMQEQIKKSPEYNAKNYEEETADYTGADPDSMYKNEPDPIPNNSGISDESIQEVKNKAEEDLREIPF